MAFKLGELLISLDVISEAQLQEALRSQSFYGGKLGTNLVELGHVTESRLAAVLSRQLGIQCAEPGDFENVPEEVLGLVPLATVQKHHVVPLGKTNRVLRLAMVDPMDLRLIDELSFSTGCRIDPVIAPEVLILYGMERLYGIPRGSRYLKLTQKSGTTGDFQVVQTSSTDDDMPLVVDDGGVPPRRSNIAVEDRGAFLDLERAEFREQPRYTLEMAAAELARVDAHQDLFEVVRRFFVVLFDQLALFSLRGGSVVGWLQSGCRLSDSELRKLSFPLQQSLLFREGCRSAAPYVGPVPVTDFDTRLFRSLGIAATEELLLLPVTLNAQPLIVVVASGIRRGTISDRLLLFGSFVEKVGYALQILYLKQRILGKAVI